MKQINAANIGSWHSEHAKKLTLMIVIIKVFLSLKKKSLSLHILKFNGPRES